MLQRIRDKYFYRYRTREFRVDGPAFKYLLNSFKYKFESKIVSLSVIFGTFDEKPCDELNSQDTRYNWDRLRESLIKNKHIDIFNIYELSDKDGRYYNPDSIINLQTSLYAISDGNHRLAILKCLYGLNHKVTIHLNPILRKSFFVSLILFIIDRYKNSKRLLKILLKLIIPSYQDPLYNTYENTKNIKNTYYLYGYKERLKEVKNKTYKPHDK